MSNIIEKPWAAATTKFKVKAYESALRAKAAYASFDKSSKNVKMGTVYY
ncbi:hypothetical protein [Luteithermobacter gelatinilyticus]|nr:hypothetical protein [Luteithermobacter gelatinilyticus]